MLTGRINRSEVLGDIRGGLHIGGRPNERYTEAIIRLNKIFSIEGELSSLTPEDRKKQRIIREQSELEAFWLWAKKNAVSSSKKFVALVLLSICG